MRLIDRHTRGQIIINGQNLERVYVIARIPIFRRHIGFMFQDHRLLNDRTVFDNVALPLVIAGYRHQEIRKRVQAALDKVSLLQKVNSYPMALSGGEQQRVGVARAVVHRPAILLADEPTGNLDPALSWDTMKLFEQFNQVGVTVLIASHDLDMIRRMSKRIITLRGRSRLTSWRDTHRIMKQVNRKKNTRARRKLSRASLSVALICGCCNTHRHLSSASGNTLNTLSAIY